MKESQTSTEHMGYDLTNGNFLCSYAQPTTNWRDLGVFCFNFQKIRL